MNAPPNKSGLPRSVIGISVDNRENTVTSGKYEVAIAYSRCVIEAGGVPVLLPHEQGMAGKYAQLCDGVVLTGGGDPVTEAFGAPTHPSANRIDPGRQAFELALLAALDEQPDKPVLGICLGMQMMALHGGAVLHQHLPEVLDDPALHMNDNRHAVTIHVDDSVLTDEPVSGDEATVVSWHHQAVACGDGTAVPNPKTSAGALAGQLRVVAAAPDGVVEAIDDPERRFYVGVQWHPERGGAGRLNQGLFDRLVAACR